MRVIAGTAKGRRLAAPPGDEVRPTADRVKEALFSILQRDVPGARALDLYAGSGALGIEALSRGAAAVTFVDSSRRAVTTIEDNLAACGFADRAEIVSGEVAEVLRRGASSGQRRDLAFLDPPYAAPPEDVTAVLELLVPCLVVGARVAVEAPRSGPAPRWPTRFRVAEPRRYGGTVLHCAWLADDEGA